MPFKFNPELYFDSTLFRWWQAISITRRLNGLSDISIEIPNNAGQFTTRIANGQPMQVNLGWDTDTPNIFWAGEVEKITITAKKNGSLISIWGRDKGRIFDKERTVDDNFQPYSDFLGKYGGLIQYLNSQVSKPLTVAYSASLTDVDIVKSFTFDKTLDVITEAARRGGYEWFFEGRGDQLVVRPPKTLISDNIVKTYILGRIEDFLGLNLENYAYMVEDEVEIDSSDKITRVRFDGLGSVKGIYPSTLPAELIEHYDQSDEWLNNAAALQAATNYFNAHRFDRTSLSIEVPFGEMEVGLGDIIQCDDSHYGLSAIDGKLFRVIEIQDTIKKNSWTSQLKLGDFQPRITDFI